MFLRSVLILFFEWMLYFLLNRLGDHLFWWLILLWCRWSKMLFLLFWCVVTNEMLDHFWSSNCFFNLEIEIIIFLLLLNFSILIFFGWRWSFAGIMLLLNPRSNRLSASLLFIVLFVIISIKSWSFNWKRCGWIIFLLLLHFTIIIFIGWSLATIMPFLNPAANWWTARRLFIVLFIIIIIKSWSFNWKRCWWSIFLLLV